MSIPYPSEPSGTARPGDRSSGQRAATAGSAAGAARSGTVLPVEPGRGDLWFQVLTVLGVSLGASVVYAVLSLAETLLRSSLAESGTTLNRSMSQVPVIDLLRQLTSIVTAVVPVLIAVYFLAGSLRRVPCVLHRSGLDLRRPGRDALLGVALFLVMGLGTLGLYAAGRAVGATAEITTSSLEAHWWTVPVLVLSAVRHAVVEEVIVVVFLCDRLRRLRWSWTAVVLATAVFRAGYHLYQGFGPALGNLVMGLVFVGVYRRYGRAAPLLVAHTLLDVAGFLLPHLLG